MALIGEMVESAMFYHTEKLEKKASARAAAYWVQYLICSR
jgi:hypothetical protein